MIVLVLELDDDVAARLSRRAEVEGLTSEAFAMRELQRSFADPFEFVGIRIADAPAIAPADPFGFFGVGSSSERCGTDRRSQLDREGFGAR
jgi:hypothetical protein